MINIRKHGAVEGKCIGVAIKSALEEACEVELILQKQKKWLSRKNSIYIPSGRWLWETPVKWETGVGLYGENQASTLLELAIPQGEFAIDTTDVLEPYAFKVSNFHVFSLTPFKGGFINAKMTNRSSIISELFIEGLEVAMKFENCFTSVIKDCTIYGCDNGIIGSNLTNTKLYNNKIENCSYHGIHLKGSDTNTTTGTSLFGNIFQGNGRAGLYIDSLDQAFFSGNFFEGNNRIPFRRDGSFDNEAHLEIRSTKNDFTRRNSNLCFESTFFTQGHYSPDDTVCVAIHAGELISFNGGVARAFSKKSKGFYISENVTMPRVENFTFEGISEESCIYGPGKHLIRLNRNLFGLKKSNENILNYEMLGGNNS